MLHLIKANLLKALNATSNVTSNTPTWTKFRIYKKVVDNDEEICKTIY